mmetsp:Transcript_38526/g.47736  ORF Transcript_38526/g.47736 Transcript_38526/m.47736 type:complete len:229 (-) Transcript_38526:637-1323(-)
MNGTLHLDDHLLLASLQLFQSQFHPMDLLLHGRSIGLSHIGIQRCLHLFFQGDLSFPEKDLSFRFQDVLIHLILLQSQFVDVSLHVKTPTFDLLELLHEFRFHHLIGIRDLARSTLVLHHGSIHAIHVKTQMLHVVFQLSDLLLVARQLTLDADLLLLQDHLLVLVFIEAALQLVGIAGDGQQLRLLLDPILLHVRAFLRQLRNGLAHVLELGLLWPRHIFVVADFSL